MKRGKLAPQPQPQIDIGDRPTRDLSRLLPCPLCRDTGISEVLDPPLITYCGCSAGSRLRCAAWEMFPMPKREAERIAKRIGLRIPRSLRGRVLP